MPRYQFQFENDDGTVDHLPGGVELIDDAEAVAFARRVMREMMQENPAIPAMATMNVSQSGRDVQRLLLVEPCPSMWN